MGKEDLDGFAGENGNGSMGQGDALRHLKISIAEWLAVFKPGRAL